MATKKKAAKQRWAVCIDRLHKFVSSDDGKVACTTDRKEADRIAAGVGGRVVDADEWAKRPRFLNQAEYYQVFGGTAVEIGLSQIGGPVKEVRVKKATFKSGLGRKGKRMRPASITLVIEYDT